MELLFYADPRIWPRHDRQLLQHVVEHIAFCKPIDFAYDYGNALLCESQDLASITPPFLLKPNHVLD